MYYRAAICLCSPFLLSLDPSFVQAEIVNDVNHETRPQSRQLGRRALSAYVRAQARKLASPSQKQRGNLSKAIPQN